MHCTEADWQTRAQKRDRNENLWEGSFYPKMPNGKRKKFNIYAKTKEECEQALAEMITEKKAKIAAEKAKMA